MSGSENNARPDPQMAARAQSLVRDFSGLANWEDRYRKIIETGRQWPGMADERKTDALRVKGCQSQVWLDAQLDDAGRIHFVGDSDALIVRGLLAILLTVYSGSTPGEILAFPPQFLRDLGFEKNLSPSRANGLHAMVQQIRHYAVAFDLLLKSKNSN